MVIKKFLKPPQKVTVKKLLGWEDAAREDGGWRPYLLPNKYNENARMVHRFKTNTTERMYTKLDKFIENHRNQIRVFADVGAANAAGAPMAVETKRILGEKSAVFAIDIFKSPVNLNEMGVTEVLLAIQKRPLPIKCDAIRWAQTSTHMTKQAAFNALKNIWLSLKPGGYLLGATEYGTDSREFLAQPHHQFILVKVNKTKTNPLGFMEIFPKELQE